jgi:g-D-glutamyl-meso-diaminopimelate peptidase
MAAAAERLAQGCFDDWQANARGVDLRCAFDAGWTPKGEPSAAGYAGTRPMSEPECRAAANFCKAFTVRRLFVFSNGPREISYRFSDRQSPRALIAQVLANCAGAKVSDRPTAAGLKDWFIQAFDSPAFEVGVGARDDPERIFRAFSEMMMMALLI